MPVVALSGREEFKCSSKRDAIFFCAGLREWSENQISHLTGDLCGASFPEYDSSNMNRADSHRRNQIREMFRAGLKEDLLPGSFANQIDFPRVAGLRKRARRS